MLLTTTIFAAAFVLIAPNVLGAEENEGSNNIGVTLGDTYKDAASAEEYSVVVNRIIRGKKGKRCRQKLYVSGKGVKDVFVTSCTYNDMTSLTSKDELMFNNPDVRFALYSEEPGTLVVIRNGHCAQRNYVTRRRTKISHLSFVHAKRCEEIKLKMEQKVDEERKKNNIQETGASKTADVATQETEAGSTADVQQETDNEQPEESEDK